MIRLSPTIDYLPTCPSCHKTLTPNEVIWQGIHVCVAGRCDGCGREIVSDLPTGHALLAPFQVDLSEGRLFGNDEDREWLGRPFLQSLQSPFEEEVPFRVEKLRPCRNALVLNCIDYLYGHALLKLLNAEHHVAAGSEVVVIVQEPFRWLVPEGVAEIWTVGIPLSKGRLFHRDLHRRFMDECRRFESVALSDCQPHPGDFHLARFTGTPSHDFSNRDFRVTFVWREDRPWIGTRIVSGAARRLPAVNRLVLLAQNRKVRMLMEAVRSAFPQARPTVAGLGMSTRFPAWVDDLRVRKFTPESERSTCAAYGESRVVIGVHGSNMLLPSGHAGMTLDLMPVDRWANFAQDILYQEKDPRLAAYRYRYVPVDMPVRNIVDQVIGMINGYDHYRMQMGTSTYPDDRMK